MTDALRRGDSVHPAHRLLAALDAFDELPAARELRARSYELLAARSGSRIVDVGCGAGRAVAELAGLGARATGIDIEPGTVAEARRRRPDADVRTAGAYALPFGDGTLDGYRAEKVLHELDDPRRALAEAARVLAPGGRAVLIGQDWDTFVIDADDADLTRRLVHARADRVPGARTARRHRNLLLEAGFREVEVEVRTGVFTGEVALPLLAGLAQGAAESAAVRPEQARAWLAEQQERARADRLFVAVPLFVASGARA
ncbi:methyltransferase domain-containing protein [Streptomyces solicathayae]|uniref:Methyltransferase domain-containing protein n=1 Tax=Streptomyces solicathayae TaxID=3081768 RepID=A0ABZ0M2T9_9ACTN|nr:methyltransferase domain-containing protein [Streptomyces sp. HUAS YS2]WOX26094.1 methyltransferase domain-containing protein [Streptomyces sp. HUAS YS2]